MPTIEAKILRVYQDEREWYHVETDHPTVNDLRTKQVAKAREARSWAESGEVLVIDAKHQQRPREGGGVWDNYYYESARIAQHDGGSNGGEIERVSRDPMVSGSKPQDPEVGWRIALSVGVKQVSDELATGILQDTSWQGLTQRALGWATFIHTTPLPNPDSQPQRDSGSGRGAYDDEFADDRPPLDDDDIPF